MATNKTGPRYFAIMEKREQVLALRREGYTYRQIQELTGMDSSNAARLVKEHLADIVSDEADLLRQFENEKLNALARDAMDQAFEFRPELGADGKPVMEPVCDPDGLVLLDRDGQAMWRVRRDYAAANQGKALLLKIHQRRCEMFGLDAPKQTQTTFTDTNDSGEFVFKIVDARDGQRDGSTSIVPTPHPMTGA